MNNKTNLGIQSVIEKQNHSAEDKEVQALSNTNEELKSELNNEKFKFILLINGAVLIFTLRDCQSWTLPIIVGIIQLIFIISQAQRLNINFLTSLIDKILNTFSKK